MKANELRIGNWVMVAHENIPEMATARMIGYISQAEFKGHNHPFEPIPLTPEILEKCGFRKTGLGWDSDGSFNLYQSKKGLLPCNREEICGEYYITSLHQLQNLYYALTGQELNYKP